MNHRVPIVPQWALLACLGAGSVMYRSLGARSVSAWSVGEGLGWVLLCAVFGLLHWRTVGLERRLVAGGVGARDASETARSWGRRRGIVALLVVSAAAPIVFLAGAALPGPVGGGLCGAAAMLPALLLFATLTSWVELMGGSIDGKGPHCARCGYPAAEGVGSTCPECGRRVSRASDLSEGRRSHPSWVKAVGVGAPAALVVIVLVMMTPSRVAALLPTGTLIQMVDGGIGPRSRAAVSELSTRTLSEAEAAALERALDRTRPNRPPAPVMAPR